MVCHALPSRPPQHGLGLELSGSKIVDAGEALRNIFTAPRSRAGSKTREH